MLSVVSQWFDTSNLMPHGYCLLWNPLLLWVFVTSDLIIAASYYSIPFALWFFAKRRPDIQNRWLIILFGLFVMACGTTHFFDVLNIWYPNYWTDALVRIITAILSLTTAIVLWIIMPSALKAPSVQQLETANNKYKGSAQYARSLIEASLDPLVTISTEGKIMDVNVATEKITGVERQKLIGSDFSEYFTEPDKARQVYEEVYAKGFVMDYPLAIYHTSGYVTDVLYNATAYQDESGHVAGVFAAARNITERKTYEEQLKIANRELEAFAYSVSHDLRAPLRGIDGWSLALLEDYGHTLDEQAQGYLETVRSETQRMGQLIDDLLLLSRVSRGELNNEQVDLSAIAQTVSERLQRAEPERKIEFVIQSNLSTRGDARLLEVVLTNLLSNACKFTALRSEAKIEFFHIIERDKKSNTPYQLFVIRDNGVGFDMAHAQNLFGAFQRLHKASEYPGTGIGLATVQRIVHRHHGRIWAEAHLDQGATFFFTLGDSA
ncbi:ATP-binding protein [Methylicorpusculum sp.]|uniref:sensor histidine kinase n=1 Tax=Methylicorpusculum sp. TaxID=2713644 RepID=UPI002718A877|nr:ATP-binding protein [Methylicorpusculum sp.]MDO8845028.1 PAS domain S-box protein [Methylicorpusculum sp.]